MTQLPELNLTPVKRGDAVVGRYAPSPTGRQHLGNLRTALVAWLQTRVADGIFVLRMEDLDTARTRPGCAEEILEDLRWLGLDWDEGPDVGGPAASYVQSERTMIYQDALDLLASHGATFDCYCSRKDIAQSVSAPHGIDGPVYPGTCRINTDVKSDRAAAVRCEVGESDVTFTDVVAGDLEFDMARDVGDFVVRRADGLFAYQLAVSVDDALMGITDVVRGADLLTSTPRQIYLLKTLQLPAPTYWHVPVKHDVDGNRLSKRDGSHSLVQILEHNTTPETVVGQLAHELGLIDRPEAISTMELRGEVKSDSFVTTMRRLGSAGEAPS